MTQALAYLEMGALIPLLFTFLMVHNLVVRWERHLEYRRKVYEHIKSILHNRKKSDRDAVLSHVAMYMYYNEHLNGSEGLHGTRPFLVGLWRWIVSPLCILFFPSYVVLLFSNLPYRGYVILLLIVLTVIVYLFMFFFDRFEKIQTISPVSPSDGIEKIKKAIC